MTSLKKKKWPSEIVAYTDGASRGNPGPCSYGLQILNPKGELIHEEGKYLKDDGTNNFAEYKAVIRSLELASINQVKKIQVFSDSQLLVNQLKGLYKVKTPSIRILFRECQSFLKKIPECEFFHIPREKNYEADALANEALDNKGLERF